MAAIVASIVSVVKDAVAETTSDARAAITFNYAPASSTTRVTTSTQAVTTTSALTAKIPTTTTAAIASTVKSSTSAVSTTKAVTTSSTSSTSFTSSKISTSIISTSKSSTSSSSTKTSASTTSLSSTTTHSSSKSTSISTSATTTTSHSSSTSAVASNAADASTNKSTDSGSPLSTGVIAAISVAGVLAVLALALVGYRYWKRKQRQDRRRRSGLEDWAGGPAIAGWGRSEGSDNAWAEREKETISPFPMQTSAQSQEMHIQDTQPLPHQSPSRASLPQPPHPQQQVQQMYQQQQYSPYGQEYAYGQQQYPSVPAAEKALPPFPQPATMSPQHVTPPAWLPGTPNTFGSVASATGSPVMAQPTNPLSQAHAKGLFDGAPVVVKQGFVRSLDDELVITPGETLLLVQAYDDGWCLCEKASPEGLVDRGVVPLNCLEAFNGASAAEQSVQIPQSAVTGHIGIPDSAQTQEVLTGGHDQIHHGPMARSATMQSLVSERSERRSSLFINAATAGLWLQAQPLSGGR